jgi:glycosyltransferase involved in cell wall biosynthesis
LNTVVLIPAYQPDTVLINLVDELIIKGIPYIVIVDDGSSDDKKQIFSQLDNREKCLVIHHSQNMGKGRALKTGIDAVLNSHTFYEGIITADADGQHLTDDIIKTIEVFEQQPDALVLGCRNISQKNVPFKSKLGNKLTRYIFRLTSGVRVSDTQTGLRAFSLENAKHFVKIEGNRYEFEMNMLLEAVKNGIQIKETEIEAVYLDSNRSSHFNPFIDSFYVYKRFLKYAASAILSFLVDITLYAVFSSLFVIAGFGEFILYATVLSRILSSVFNFFCNKNFVFNNKNKSITIVIKYYILCVSQMLVSAFLVRMLYEISSVDTVLLKSIVDIMLACVSYNIQKKLVFRR